jgi:hypothetical protein
MRENPEWFSLTGGPFARAFGGDAKPTAYDMERGE